MSVRTFSCWNSIKNWILEAVDTGWWLSQDDDGGKKKRNEIQFSERRGPNSNETFFFFQALMCGTSDNTFGSSCMRRSLRGCSDANGLTSRISNPLYIVPISNDDPFGPGLAYQDDNRQGWFHRICKVTRDERRWEKKKKKKRFWQMKPIPF